MSNLVPFQFESHAVRVLTDPQGDPLFFAVDVCAALGIVNARDALSKLDADEKTQVIDVDTVGLTDGTGINNLVNVVTESGLYTLILRCRDATTPGTVPHRFRKWVTSEVLPSIRKTGGYAVPMTPGQALVEMAQNFLRHETQIAELSRRQQETAAQVMALMDGENYLTVVGWGNLTGLRLDSATASRIGKLASALCRERGHHIGTTLHPAYGRVNTYPREVLDELGATAQD